MMPAFAYFRVARADKAVSTSKRVANKDAGHAGVQLVLGVIARQQGNDKRADIRREINTLLDARIVEEKSYQEYRHTGLISGLVVFGFQFQRNGIHAVALPGRHRAVRKHVPQMRITACTQYLGSFHQHRPVRFRRH